MTRTLTDALRWTIEGGLVLEDALSRPRDETTELLPGWTRAHLVAHLAANAEALGNLAHWAATGTPTPMYASPEQRDADIAEGATRPLAELVSWSGSAQAALEQRLAGLTESQWQTEIRTAQGRLVPATEIPWLRAREVWVHTVDLDAGVGFADLPEDFLVALCEDVVAKRSQAPAAAVTVSAGGHRWELPGEGPVLEVSGPLPQVAAFLTGRPHTLTTTAGEAVADLTAWL